MLKDKRFVIEHVVRGRWSALEREQQIKAWAERDRELIKGSYEIGVEQEPGSAGKESAENTIRNLAGYKVFADKVTGSKEVRAEPFAAQVQGGNVWLIAGPWQPRIFGRARAIPERQVQGPSRRKYGRVQPARLTSELQPGRPCIMMQATATLSLELFMRARRRFQSLGCVKKFS